MEEKVDYEIENSGYKLELKTSQVLNFLGNFK